MSVDKIYEIWMSKELSDQDLTQELLSIKEDENEIYERFYRSLEFGTAGLRGIIGAGTNRMNVYTVGAATQGFADYLNDKSSEPSIAIAYDSRIKSDLFAKTAATVMAANGVKVYIYDELMPTPMLSYAVRALDCDAGIVVTASHNPAKYNGYKAYGPDGCQMTEESADAVYEKIQKVDLFSGIKDCDFDTAMREGKIEYISEEVINTYLFKVLELSINPDAIKTSNIKVVYTPLNGTGNKPVRKILAMQGLGDLTMVKEQENPDGNFTTCSYPNPEIRESLQLGLDLCKELNADLLLATDPDADRVGIAVPNGDGYQLITGNEVGALLLDYICKGRIANGTMPKDPVAVKSFVTTNLAVQIAKDYGVEMRDVLTGFKYIGEQILGLEQAGQEDRFILGFEESYGYLSGTFVRDKDAVIASMLICEMTAYYKAQGKSVADVLEGLYEKHGRFLHDTKSFTCEGAQGMVLMAEIMERLKAEPPMEFAGLKVINYKDYSVSKEIDYLTGAESVIDLPKANALYYQLEDNCAVIIRPSGTEPKIKAYYTVTADTLEKAEVIKDNLHADTVAVLGF